MTGEPLDHEEPAPTSAGTMDRGEGQAWLDRIVSVRGRRVMLHVNLARVYGVAPKRLNEQERRNRARFPEDFAFPLTLDEARVVLASRSQTATLKRGTEPQASTSGLHRTRGGHGGGCT